MLKGNLSICVFFSSVEDAVQQHNICGGRQLKPPDTLTSSGHLELEVWFQLAGLTEPNRSSHSHSLHSALQYSHTGSHFENEGVLSAEGSCSPEAVLPLAGRLLCILGRHLCYSMHSVQPHVAHFKALFKSRTLESLLSLRKGLHELYFSAHMAPDSPSDRIFESCCNQQGEIRALTSMCRRSRERHKARLQKFSFYLLCNKRTFTSQSS